ncbi:sensor histidine kinase [Atopobium fossor]|uniref:sensor histidine kinase n=1 Tax=Atopobium fossor TaxID=39487 RepID=UPI000685948D|nr:HAMP domain-containing sensor histidine kinase [Atopobium fossor]
MELVLHNRHIKAELICLLLIGLACTAVTWIFAGNKNAVVVGVMALALTCAHIGFTMWHTKQIAKLTQRVDDALHADNPLSFADMREGELALLGNQIDKTFGKLVSINTQLEVERQSLGDSLADISHQLRTPMTSLGLELELIRKHTADPEVSRRLRHGEQLIDRMRWLIETLLRLARIDAGAIHLEQKQVQVVGLVRDALRPLEVALDLADITIEQHIDADASFIGDPAWSCEALQNVLKNCLEHTPVGGTITIQVSEDSLACRIVITDSGTGFDEQELPHIFERFYRGRTTSTVQDRDIPATHNATDVSADGILSHTASNASPVNPSGVGIGLSLAQALIFAQGGRIRALNKKDVNGQTIGACFEIAFYKTVV